jgi:hypothetical protein
MSGVAINELVARAVAAELTQSSIDTICTYKVLVDIDLKELASKTICTARDMGEEMTYVSRSQTQHDYFVEVAFRRRGLADRESAITSLKYLMEQVADYWRFRPLAGRPETFNRVSDRRVIDDAAYKKQCVLVGSVTLVFRGYKE